MSNYYPPSLTLARLYERTSQKGQTYFAGRLGYANVVLLPTEEVTEYGQRVFVLKISEGQQRSKEKSDPIPQSTERDRVSAANDYERPFDDQVPF